MTDSQIQDPPLPEPFWRPSPRLNRLVEQGLLLFPRRPLDPAEITAVKERTVSTFLQLGASQAVLDRALSETEWRISADRAPSDAWGGEVLKQDGGPPLVILYRDSPLTRVPARWLFRIGSQLAVDHMLGHLYEYYTGAEDWGEEAAARWQFRLLRQRGGMVNNLTALVMAVMTRLHKKIPLSNYA